MSDVLTQKIPPFFSLIYIEHNALGETGRLAHHIKMYSGILIRSQGKALSNENN